MLQLTWTNIGKCFKKKNFQLLDDVNQVLPIYWIIQQ